MTPACRRLSSRGPSRGARGRSAGSFHDSGGREKLHFASPSFARLKTELNTRRGRSPGNGEGRLLGGRDRLPLRERATTSMARGGCARSTGACVSSSSASKTPRPCISAGREHRSGLSAPTAEGEVALVIPANHYHPWRRRGRPGAWRVSWISPIARGAPEGARGRHRRHSARPPREDKAGNPRK